MSKLQCTCGYIIFDQTDFNEYKGHIIADQDYYDLFSEIERKNWESPTSIAERYFNEIFQCSNCNNIIFLTNNRRFDFSPLEKELSSNLLSSSLKEKWAGIMRASFSDNEGEIFWDTNKESDFIQHLALNELKELYYNKYNEFINLEILRESSLIINNDIEHQFRRKANI